MLQSVAFLPLSLCLPGESFIDKVDSTIPLPPNSQDPSLVMKMEKLTWLGVLFTGWSLEHR